MKPKPSSSRCPILLPPGGVLIGFCIAMSVFFLAAPTERLLLLLPDDAFYYLTIAANWTEGHPSSFDRIEPTNGYHPLWQWLLVMMAAVVDSREWLMRLAGVAGVFCMAGCGWLLSRALRQSEEHAAGFAGVWVALTLVPAMVYGMEMPLALLLLAGFIRQHQIGVHSWSQAFSWGMIAALLVLSRLDSIVYVAAAACAIGVRNPLPLRYWFAMVLPGLVFVGGYGLATMYLFGQWTPISASTKFARSGWFSLEIPFCFLMGAAVGIACVSVWILIKRLSFSWLAAANLIYLGLILARGGEETWDWYFALPVATGALLLPVLSSSLDSRGSGNRILQAVLLIVLVTGTAEWSTRENKFMFNLDRARKLSEYPADHFTFAASDCGILGYFSRQRWINLDGLTAGTGFHEALKDNRLADWLREKGLNAMVDYRQEPYPETLTLHAWPGVDGVARSVTVSVTPEAPLDDHWMIMRVTGILENEP